MVINQTQEPFDWQSRRLRAPILHDASMIQDVRRLDTLGTTIQLYGHPDGNYLVQYTILFAL